MLAAERRNSDRWGRGGIEPSLDELLADPATLALMRADGVTIEDVRTVVSDVKRCVPEVVDRSIPPSATDEPAPHESQDCDFVAMLALLDAVSLAELELRRGLIDRPI